jgi:hypothetical protein
MRIAMRNNHTHTVISLANLQHVTGGYHDPVERAPTNRPDAAVAQPQGSAGRSLGAIGGAIAGSQLARVVGGYRDPGTGSSGTSGTSGSTLKEPNDFAKGYVGKLKKDKDDWWQREQLGGQAVIDHKYGTAAKHYGAALLDELGALGDLLSPIFGGGIK